MAIKFSINQQGNYYAVSFSYTLPNGVKKRTQKSTGVKYAKGNKRLAEEKAREIVAQYEDIPVNFNNISFVDYCKDYLSRTEKRHAVPTHDEYIRIFEKHIKPWFGNIKLTDIKPRILETYYTEKEDSGLSGTTVHKHHELIGVILQDAYKNEYIKNNSARLATAPKKEKPQIKIYTPEQMKILFDTVKGTKLETPVYLAMYFGLRRSEATGLKWESINFETKTMLICDTKVIVKRNGTTQEIERNTTKTDNSNRSFILSDEHCNYLKAVREKQLRLQAAIGTEIKHVCTDEIGEPIKNDYFTRTLGKIIKKYNLPKITPHGLRHSNGSALATNPQYGAVQASTYLGHANYAFTVDTYVHVSNEQKANGLNLITELIGADLK